MQNCLGWAAMTRPNSKGDASRSSKKHIARQGRAPNSHDETLRSVLASQTNLLSLHIALALSPALLSRCPTYTGSLFPLDFFARRCEKNNTTTNARREEMNHRAPVQRERRESRSARPRGAASLRSTIRRATRAALQISMTVCTLQSMTPSGSWTLRTPCGSQRGELQPGRKALRRNSAVKGSTPPKCGLAGQGRGSAEGILHVNPHGVKPIAPKIPAVAHCLSHKPTSQPQRNPITDKQYDDRTDPPQGIENQRRAKLCCRRTRAALAHETCAFLGLWLLEVIVLLQVMSQISPKRTKVQQQHQLPAKISPLHSRYASANTQPVLSVSR